jgi:hypothetical protein
VCEGNVKTICISKREIAFFERSLHIASWKKKLNSEMFKKEIQMKSVAEQNFNLYKKV